ncbi:DUF2085 domain-containing protein [Chakrabartyella piscis]|uniref:DUF2085 domain-containing protein n=1 Tax=Chakrabartyella piscis TaxID=2918914 RepID=UPI0029589A4C|nr:DUF2085 domain-containing protein [Chakrabartyella piscis]
MVERSFIWNGQPFMVCARCTGIYIGIFVAMVFFLWNKRLGGNKPYSMAMALLGAFAFLPIAIDGFFSYMSVWESNNLMRVISGSLAGCSLVGFGLLAANVSWKEKNEKPIYRDIKEQLVVLVSSLVLGLVMYVYQGFFLVASVMVSIGILCFWSGFFYIVLQALSCNWKLKNGWISLICGLLMILMIGGVRF